MEGVYKMFDPLRITKIHPSAFAKSKQNVFKNKKIK